MKRGSCPEQLGQLYSRYDEIDRASIFDREETLKPQIQIPTAEIRDFCERREITELSFFGSVLREDFGPDSDVDVLVRFHPNASHTLFDMVRMRDELSRILGHQIDLVSRRGIQGSRNYLRRKAILGSAEVVYAA